MQFSQEGQTRPPQPLHFGFKSFGFSAAAELVLPLRMANLAPAIACGLSLPVTLPAFVGRGWG